MGDVINLNRYRKRRERRAAEERASENRAKSGLSRHDRDLLEREHRRHRRSLDGKHLDNDPPGDTPA